MVSAADSTAPLSSPVDLLLYGEGDFSFTHSLSRADRTTLQSLLGVSEIRSVVSTSLDSLQEVVSKYPGFLHLSFPQTVHVVHSVDAVSKDSITDLGLSSPSHVLWNHPHLGIENAQFHFELLCHFFAIQAESFTKETIVIVSLLSGQSERWRLREAAGRAGFQCMHRVPFVESHFPGYTAKRNLSGSSFKSQHAVENSRTGDVSSEFYVFGTSLVQTDTMAPTTVALGSVPVATPLACPVCSKSFASLQGLKTHVRQVHELQRYSKRESVCDLCGKVFADPVALANHEKAMHWQSQPAKRRREDLAESETSKNDYHCALCDSRDPNHLELFSAANRTETFPCDSCDKVFREPRALAQHASQVH